MSKIYIGLITSNGNTQYLNWYNGISNYIDGLAVVWHGKRDLGFDILNNNKGEGFIIEREFYGNHSHSMNDFFLNPKIRPGDWIILRDTLEQLHPAFLSDIRKLIGKLEENNINSVFQYSKLFIFKKTEHQLFMGSPHWGLQRPEPGYLEIDKQPGFEDPRNYAFSIRNDIREPDHFINHFVKYYLYDSSNHLLLGREGNNNEFQLHENIRLKLKKYCQENLKIELNVDSLLSFIKTKGLDFELKFYFNFEPILNSFYCYHILGHSVSEIQERLAKKANFKIE